MRRNQLYKQIFLFASVLISLTYIGVGILFLVSSNIQEVLPTKTAAYIVGSACTVYGVFRVWRSIFKFKTDKSE